ncbi:MAG: primosomal protein N' [Acholeplasmatales bacterium]|nr:primosomal protein N' [Acholeplasmatales bacterium]
MNALVIVDVKAKQVNKPYTYIVPKEFEGIIERGSRVLVPFGPRNVLGFVMDLIDEVNNEGLKEIKEVLDLVPVLSMEMLDLARKIAHRTSSFLITVLKTMIPNALSISYKKTIRKLNDNLSSEISKYFTNSDEIDMDSIAQEDLNSLKYEIRLKNVEVIYDYERKDKIKEDSFVKLVKYAFLKESKQQEILDYLLEKKEVNKKELNEFSQSSLKTLEKNGFVEIYKKEVYREVKNQIDRANVVENLNDEQTKAYNSIDLYDKKTYLLYGVTGSGKTEVYIRLILDCLEMGKSAIFLVPEISLTPQMAARVKMRIKDCAIFHSAMNDNERYDEWRKIYRGEVKVVVGARSAIFSPLKDIGIIIIDEEHEHTYKQDSNPRYNAKDVARMRADYHNCPLVLGSATPSIDSFYKAKNGEYELLTLKYRANNSVLPNMHIINMSNEIALGNRSMFSNTLSNLISDRLEKNEQVMLLINKRGYSSFIMCRSCGEAVKCPNCDITLTYHKTTDKLVCHYCGYKMDKVTECPSCHSNMVKEIGIGSEQVEEQVKKKFNTTVIRMDSDTTTKKGSHAQMIKDFMDEKASVLVGTQMISKGLDFDKVTLVGILLADITLKMPDYRNSERTYDLIMQVAGRAGRRDIKGDVVVQSYNTNHYSIDTTKYNNYEVFYDKEIKYRELSSLPPFINLSQIVIEHDDYKKAYEYGQIIKNKIKQIYPLALVVGPASANIARVNNKFRVQLTIKNKSDNYDLFKILEEYQDINIYVDHDPTLI